MSAYLVIYWIHILVQTSSFHKIATSSSQIDSQPSHHTLNSGYSKKGNQNCNHQLWMHSMCQSLSIVINPHIGLAREICLHSQIRKMRLREIKEVLSDHKLSPCSSLVPQR